MLITCILKDGVVYLPTVAKTEAGFYMDREPVGPNSCKALRSGPLRRTKGPTESFPIAKIRQAAQAGWKTEITRLTFRPVQRLMKPSAG